MIDWCDGLAVLILETIFTKPKKPLSSVDLGRGIWLPLNKLHLPNQPARIDNVDVMTWKDALKIGFAQAFALFPGGLVPQDRAERERLYDAANRSARTRLNRRLWQEDHDRSREKRLAEFIRMHADQLGDLDCP